MESLHNRFINEFPQNVTVDDDVIFIHSDGHEDKELKLTSWEEVSRFTSNLITAANFTFGPQKKYDDERLV